MSSSNKISLKLLVNIKSKKVLFAEVGKEFVDFVFTLLTLPVGAVAKLISAGAMHDSIGRPYQSMGDIGGFYLLPSKDKADLLRHPPPSPLATASHHGPGSGQIHPSSLPTRETLAVRPR
ncbi:hypothetical protein ZWY2020_028634 [Hordeum vulgare]|nr:hypothetical protein ZWY2020_028634 [Hordeum vulgare]